MFPSSSLLSFLLLGASAHANSVVKVRESPITLPLVRRINLAGTTIANLDRASLAHLIDAGTTFDPNRRLLSWSWITANLLFTSSRYGKQTFVPTSTSQNTGKKAYKEYGTGFFQGVEYLDTVTFSSDLVIANQSVGIASNSSGFDGFDGVLGLGPVNLTDGSVEGQRYVPTVTRSLFEQKRISEEVLGVFFAPTTNESVVNGFLTFGSVDKSKTTSDLSYVPVTKTSPASYYWGINQTITYGSNGDTILSNSAGTIDSGATLILLANEAFDNYVSLTGATIDNSTGLLKISRNNYDKLQSLLFHIGEQTYEFTANAQTWPRALNKEINGAEDGIYLIISSSGSSSDNPGFMFLNGYVFLERFYSIYDTANNRIGLAMTTFTYDNIN